MKMDEEHVFTQKERDVPMPHFEALMTSKSVRLSVGRRKEFNWMHLDYQMIPAIASESRDSRDSPLFGPFFGGFTRPSLLWSRCWSRYQFETGSIIVPSLWRHKSTHFFGSSDL